MAEELRLEASVIDKFSKPLKDLRNRLNEVRPPEHIARMANDFRKVEGAVQGATKSIQSGLGQAMAGLSLPSLAAIASIGGIVAAVKGFSGATIELRQFQRETGITVGSFKALKHAASQFGVNEDAIAPGLKRFSENLFDFSRRYGSVYAEIQQRGPEFMKKLRESSPDKALSQSLDYLEQVARTQGPRVAGLLADKLFGSDQFARFGLRGLKPLHDALKAVRSGSITAADEDIAVRFAQSVEKLQEAFSKVSKTVGNELAPAFVHVMESTNQFLDANRGKIGTAVKDALDSITDAARKFDWKGLGQDLTSIGAGLHTIVSTFRSSQNFAERFLSGKRFGPEGVEDDLNEAKQKLADYDKKHRHGGAAGLRGASSPEREALVGEIKRLEELQKATAKGTEQGMQNFFQRQSFTGKGFGAGGGLGGGGQGPIEVAYRQEAITDGTGAAAARRAIRKSFGEGGAGGGTPVGHNLGASGRGASGGRNIPTILRAAHDQLLKEGVTSEHARAAAAALVGNVVQESGGNPNLSHDGGTGYGIYGARLGRRSRMLAWLSQNGYAANSAEGQARFMAHEAMTDPSYRRTASALRQASEANLGAVTDTVAKNFESPAPRYANYQGRINNAYNAYRKAVDGLAEHHAKAAPRSETAMGAAVEKFRSMQRRMGWHPGDAHPPVPPSLKPYGDIKQGRGSVDPMKPGWMYDRLHPKNREQSALLRIEIDEHGKVRRTKADGGNLFHRMDIARGRSMIAASQNG